MPNKSTPVFPMSESQHYSDYGFDPQFDFFQVLEEAMKHGKKWSLSSPDPCQFKLEKPMFEEQAQQARTKKRAWWRPRYYYHSLLFWKKNKSGSSHRHHRSRATTSTTRERCSVSGPLPLCFHRADPLANPRFGRNNSGPLGSLAAGEL